MSTIIDNLIHYKRTNDFSALPPERAKNLHRNHVLNLLSNDDALRHDITQLLLSEGESLTFQNIAFENAGSNALILSNSAHQIIRIASAKHIPGYQHNPLAFEEVAHQNLRRFPFAINQPIPFIEQPLATFGPYKSTATSETVFVEIMPKLLTIQDMCALTGIDYSEAYAQKIAQAYTEAIEEDWGLVLLDFHSENLMFRQNGDSLQPIFQEVEILRHYPNESVFKKQLQQCQQLGHYTPSNPQTLQGLCNNKLSLSYTMPPLHQKHATDGTDDHLIQKLAQDKDPHNKKPNSGII